MSYDRQRCEPSARASDRVKLIFCELFERWRIFPVRQRRREVPRQTFQSTEEYPLFTVTDNCSLHSHQDLRWNPRVLTTLLPISLSYFESSCRVYCVDFMSFCTTNKVEPVFLWKEKPRNTKKTDTNVVIYYDCLLLFLYLLLSFFSGTIKEDDFFHTSGFSLGSRQPVSVASYRCYRSIWYPKAWFLWGWESPVHTIIPIHCLFLLSCLLLLSSCFSSNSVNCESSCLHMLNYCPERKL